MNNEENRLENDSFFASWEVPEYISHERSAKWYIIAGGFAFLLLIYSFFTSNFLLPVILIISAFIFILQHNNEPEKVIISIDEEGVQVGKKFYDYDEFKNFAIVYKPNQNDKNLYFEFENMLKLRLSIPLEDMNPIPIRKHLLKYLKEDLDRTTIPLSEALTKLFKL